jgi:amidophosphoribosyltransferase
MSELKHECGVAAIYHYNSLKRSPLCPDQGPREVSRLMPRMLLDIQNRGQLAAGMSVYQSKDDHDPGRLLRTYKDLGTVSEVFRLSHKAKSEAVMKSCVGSASIGHVRYATCGADDIDYAQPFERQHLQKHKSFCFAFNGQLSNREPLKEELLKSNEDYHLTLDSDTEIIMYEIGKELSGDRRPELIDVMRAVSKRFDGAYSLAFLDAKGRMLVARDPLGIKPMCYAYDDALFAAASESVALLNLGFANEKIFSLKPGEAITVSEGGVKIERFCEERKSAHCFFEWIYFANVASTLDEKSVYVSRTNLGTELARIEKERNEILIDEDTIVVPVPDTSKAAADAMAFALSIPSREGLIRNRYSGRTFIEGEGRRRKAESKYTPLRQVLEGKRVFLVEDSIVRSTTMRVLIERLYDIGKAKEIHVRVACPPIIAPCYYGIDMPSINNLFATEYLGKGDEADEEVFRQMAIQLKCDSLRYLPVSAVARAIGFSSSQLCQACITGSYPTVYGQKLYELDIQENGSSRKQMQPT